jgi:hypothetical protein
MRADPFPPLMIATASMHASMKKHRAAEAAAPPEFPASPLPCGIVSFSSLGAA